MSNENDVKKSMGDFTIPEEFIVRKGGQEFVKFGGLLWLSSKLGTPLIKTEFVRELTTNDRVVVRATGVLVPNETFLTEMRINDYNDPRFKVLLENQSTAYGTATISALNSIVKQFSLELAETRARARLLRLLTKCKMTAEDEVKDNIEVKNVEPYAQSTPKHFTESTPRAEIIAEIDRLTSTGDHKAMCSGIRVRYMKDHKRTVMNEVNNKELLELHEMMLNAIKSE